MAFSASFFISIYYFLDGIASHVSSNRWLPTILFIWFYTLLCEIEARYLWLCRPKYTNTSTQHDRHHSKFDVRRAAGCWLPAAMFRWHFCFSFFSSLSFFAHRMCRLGLCVSSASSHINQPQRRNYFSLGIYYEWSVSQQKQQQRKQPCDILHSNGL